VEIITSPNSRPSETWLNFVVTSKAKNNIRHYLKEQQKEESEVLGYRILEAELANRDCNIKSIPKEKIESILEVLELDDIEALYREVGLGNQYPMIIAKRMTDDVDNIISKNVKLSNQQAMPIKGTEGIIVRFAECCRPIPGDLIIGYLSGGNGLEVHLETCRAIANFRHHPEHYLKLTWDQNVQGEFKVDLTAKILNKRRVLAQLAGAISDVNANIDNITLTPQGANCYIVYLTLSVQDRAHLATVFRKIKNLKFITSLTRKKTY